MKNMFTETFSMAEAGAKALMEAPLQETVEAASVGAEALFSANNVWMMLCTALVFIMHLGFAGVEAGFTQAKNTVNILFKNTLTPVIGLITYTIVGFSLMYPDAEAGFWFAFDGFGIVPRDGGNTIEYGGAYTRWTEFLFQGMFAATAATIVSGAVAERIKINAYLIFTVIFVGIIYPIIGGWKWGYGALDAMGFYDFAGSTIVHSVGGWGALAGIIILGPRIGKYVDGKVIDKPGSSVPLAVIGVFLLWLGWFGFNGGSVLSADPALTSLVLVNTCLGACAGALGGYITGYVVFKRLDLGMVLNGILAGLVAITAGADKFTYGESMFIGLIGGILVVLSAITLDKFKLDDCVGAVSVHLTCGIWGTLAVGIFGTLDDGTAMPFLPQLYGVLIVGAAAFGAALLIFFILDKTIGTRVSKEHEEEGLDSHEHGIRGYTIVYNE